MDSSFTNDMKTIEILVDTACEVENDGKVVGVADVAKGQVVNATDAAAAVLIASKKAKAVAGS